MDEKYCECGCGQATNRDARGNPRRFVVGHNRRNTGMGWMENGYLYIRIDGRKIAFHRWVKEQQLGRRLRSDEIVHHVDFNPMNNDPANLSILSHSEHTGLHALGKRRRWTLEEKLRAHALRALGYTIQQIARMLRRPVSSTAYWLQRPHRPAK